jgi:hypothetical protein
MKSQRLVVILTEWSHPEELELQFLQRFFLMSKYWEKRHEITNFIQEEAESLYDARERFKLSPMRCTFHELSEKTHMQVFFEGLQPN